MPASGTNCYVCKNTYIGPGPICPSCATGTSTSRRTSAVQVCNICGGFHASVDCALPTAVNKLAIAAMKQRRTRPNPFTNYRHYSPPMKACPVCRGNYLIESKAGSVCSSCGTVVHNPCRNCTSTATRGIKCTDGPITQFIECQDCLFIE